MKVPQWLILVLIIVLAAAGVGSARLLAIPSLTLDFSPPEGETAGKPKIAVFLVEGVKCVDTALQAASTLEEVPGVTRFVAYASRNRVEITYDAGRLSVPALREALEGPVWVEETGEYLFQMFRVIEVDGRPVSG
jgi:hypothetical protein